MRSTQDSERTGNGEPSEQSYPADRYAYRAGRTDKRLKRDDSGRLGKRADLRRCLLQVKDLRIAVSGLIHALKGRVSIQHVLLRLDAIIQNRLRRQPDPSSIGHTADFDMRIGLHLPGYILALPGLDVQLAFKEVNGSERTHPRLLSIHCCEVIRTACLQKFIHFIHGKGVSVHSICFS